MTEPLSAFHEGAVCRPSLRLTHGVRWTSNPHEGQPRPRPRPAYDSLCFPSLCSLPVSQQRCEGCSLRPVHCLSPLFWALVTLVNRDTSVGIATGCTVEEPQFDFRSGQSGQDSLVCVWPTPTLGPIHSPVQLVRGGGSLPGSKADQSLPTSTDVTNPWICTSIATYA
jgi:hypothetical protein